MAEGTETRQDRPGSALVPAPAGLIAATASVLFWQTGLIVQKLLVADANVGSIMLIQLGAAAFTMWAALLALGLAPAWNRRAALNVAWGMMAPGLVLGLGISGAALTDGVSVALIWGLFPILGPVLARLMLREPLHWTFPAGGLLGFAGLASMTLGGAQTAQGVAVGNLLLFAAVFCAALNSVIARVLNRGRSAWYEVATLQLSGAALASLGFVAATGWAPPDLTRTGSAVAMAYLVLFMTISNFLAYNYALSRVPVAWVGLFGALAPVFGLATAALLLGVSLDRSDFLFAALVLCGVALPHLHRALSGRAP